MPRIALSLLLVVILAQVHGQKVGVVLSGGGASAITHVGVLMALEENGIPIDFITGSSMGALVGAMYASGYSPNEIDSLFRTERYRIMAQGGVEDKNIYYFKRDRPDATMINLKIDTDTLLLASLPTNLRSPILIDFEQMSGFAGAMAVSDGNMDSLFVPYRCVASDITEQRAVVFREGDLAQAVRASMSYPFYFKPIRVNGNLMMDGGLYNNFPSDVMYDTFYPDIIIGSNVASNIEPPSEDDLLSQLKAMLQQPTNYSAICENGILIEPQTSTGLFDFSDNGNTIEDGYRAAMARMPEIKAAIPRRADPEQVEARRQHFRSAWPKLEFEQVTVLGLNKRRAEYVSRTLKHNPGPIDAEDLRSRYFRLYEDDNIALLYPKAVYSPLRGNYDLELTVKDEKDLQARIGGMFSSRPINTGMIGLRYNLFGRTSSSVQATTYFGKFYAAAQVKVRSDLSTVVPLYVEPVFTIHRWDHFKNFISFFDDERPSFVILRETWGGLNTGMGLSNKGLVRLDLKYAQTKDSYYQTIDFNPKDTADITEFFHFNGGLRVERNSLNRKQHPNAGENLLFEVRYMNGEERTTPGNTNSERKVWESNREWFTLKARADKYFLPRGIFKFGAMVEGVYSTYPFFQNYTASIIRAPVFQPTPESMAFFLENFRASQYVAGGLRMIAAVARNRFDLRLEGYVFQPYRAIVRGEGNSVEEGTEISDRALIGSGSLIYQSPIGPLWFNTSYIDGLKEPWVWSVNFGYMIFAQRVSE